jgi:Fur family ferric uptake transcriptional regulator
MVGDAENAAKLRRLGLRVTPIRLAVFRVLSRAHHPMSHRDVVEQLRGTDRVSIFRTLTSLVDAKLARRVELGDHTWRFELVDAGDDAAWRGTFSCIRCLQITRFQPLEIRVGPDVSAAVVAGLEDGEVQVRGVCGTCR